MDDMFVDKEGNNKSNRKTLETMMDNSTNNHSLGTSLNKTD